MAERRKTLSDLQLQQIMNDEDDDIFDDSDEDEIFSPDSDAEDESYSSSNNSVESVVVEDAVEIDHSASVTYLSKDKSVVWKQQPPLQTGRLPKNQILLNKPGPTKRATSMVTDIKSSFDLFISPNIKNIVIQMTNQKGLELYGNNWQTIDMIELDAYIGLQIMAGVYKSHGENLTSLWNEKNGRPIFRATMSLKRFASISKFLRFNSSEDREERRLRDELAPIRNVWDKWSNQLKVFYNPHENVTVDEQLVPFRGRCSFRQYIPSKPARYGIKIWALCDSTTKYAWNMKLYTGKARNTQPEKNQGERVVLTLSDPLPKGCTITCDNFFTTYNLAIQLLCRNITLVGTVRKNKTFLPSKILDMKKSPYCTLIFCFQMI